MALAGPGQSDQRGQQQWQQDSSFPESSLLVLEDEAPRTESLRAATGSLLKPGYLCHHADIPETESKVDFHLQPKEGRASVPTDTKC